MAVKLQKVLVTECAASCYTETSRSRINILMNYFKYIRHAGLIAFLT